MNNKVYLTNANIVLRDDEVKQGSLLIEDGIISAINPILDPSSTAIEISLNGQHLVPGLIDLHCDALEKEVEPRPNVHFPLDFAVAQADRRNAAAGITTVYHALSFANEELGVRNNEFAANIARAVHAWQSNALVDNRVHCRYEITDQSALPVLIDLLEKQDMHLLSLMDHTPGQGQFKNLSAYKDYMSRTYKTSDDDLETLISRKQEAAAGAFERIKTLVKLAHQYGISIASHDDDNLERVDTMKGLGVNISEFPINLETAKYAKANHVSTIFGAPNLLRGKSQSGSMKALDAILNGVADCLCADYSPATLLPAVFSTVEKTDLNLAQAMQLVTFNPATAAGLQDRGEIAVGKRADLVSVQRLGGLPFASHVWVEGNLVFQTKANTYG